MDFFECHCHEQSLAYTLHKLDRNFICCSCVLAQDTKGVGWVWIQRLEIVEGCSSWEMFGCKLVYCICAIVTNLGPNVTRSYILEVLFVREPYMANCVFSAKCINVHPKVMLPRRFGILTVLDWWGNGSCNRDAESIVSTPWSVLLLMFFQLFSVGTRQ